MNTSAKLHLEKMLGRMTLGKAIRSIRQGEGESQVDFSKRINVSKQYLCDLEHDRKTVSAKKAKAFAEILGYSPEQFIALAIQDALKHDGMHMLVKIRAA